MKDVRSVDIQKDYMRTNPKHNNFTDETHFLFMDDNYWVCWKCNRNHANCGHHIFGRGKVEGPESSPLNYAPLNNFDCHLPCHGWLTTDEGKRAMFQKTLDYLGKRAYTLTELDNEFLEKYKLEIYRLRIKL